MKSDFFSEELLNSYLDSLKKTSKEEDRLKRTQYIIDWLDWLRSKDLINNTEYERSLDAVKKQFQKQAISSPDVQKYVTKFTNKYLLIAIILLVMAVGYIYKNQLYNSISYRSKQQVISNSRTLPYKGKLLDEKGLPITSKTDIIFRIYTSPNVGDPVYVGSCKGQNAIEPDYNGNFTVVLGSDCGMSYIPESVFQSNKEIYLGVQLGAGSELMPRQKISTSGYSSDAAKLQGLPLGSEKGSIPFINKEGQVLFKQNNPTIKTSAGTFTIESPDIAIKTTGEDNGSILFQPSSKGNTIIGNGKFAVGTVTPVTLFTVEGLEPFSSVGSIRNIANDDNESLTALSLHIGAPVTSTQSTFVKFYAEATQESDGRQVGSIRLNNEGVAYETSGADFAEYFATGEDNIPPGYIMSLSSKGVHKGEKGEHIVGVTSSNAGFVGNKKYLNKNNSLIALVGQVKVLVVNSKGSMNVGDAVSISGIPGYGEKGDVNQAGIVGYVLENEVALSCPTEAYNLYGSTVQCGKVLILLK